MKKRKPYRFFRTERYLKSVDSFKNLATACLTVHNYLFEYPISYFVPYVRIKMSRTINICQPCPSTFTFIYFSRLIIYYFRIPHNFVLSTVR